MHYTISIKIEDWQATNISQRYHILYAFLSTMTNPRQLVVTVHSDERDQHIWGEFQDEYFDTTPTLEQFQTMRRKAHEHIDRMKRGDERKRHPYTPIVLWGDDEHERQWVNPHF